VLSVADEEFPGMKLQRVGRECPPAPEVVHDFVDPLIRAGDRVLAGNVPFDVLSEQGSDQVGVAARIHRVLSRMKLIKDFLSNGAIHEQILTHLQSPGVRGNPA
jgi:hypothetical protein